MREVLSLAGPDTGTEQMKDDFTEMHSNHSSVGHKNSHLHSMLTIFNLHLPTEMQTKKDIFSRKCS